MRRALGSVFLILGLIQFTESAISFYTNGAVPVWSGIVGAVNILLAYNIAFKRSG